jgi:hypothetical protein
MVEKPADQLKRPACKVDVAIGEDDPYIFAGEEVVVA